MIPRPIARSAPMPIQIGAMRLRTRPATAPGLSLSLLAERPEVLLDRRPEAGRHFVGSRQRQRLVLAAVRLLTQAELPVLHLLERCRLQRREAPRIGEYLIVVELLQIADDLVELARVLARLRELLPQRLRVGLPLTRVTTELTDVVRRVAPLA